VWAFEEIFAASLPLSLTPTATIQIPTVARYAATKLGAWRDRSDWLEAKDAADLALVLHWYAESAGVHERLYESPSGNEILIAEGTDVPLAAAHLLGVDVGATVGPARLTELLARWPGDARPVDPRTRTARRADVASRARAASRPSRRAHARACNDIE
jgi:predicted nucleotidyltransferase